MNFRVPLLLAGLACVILISGCVSSPAVQPAAVQTVAPAPASGAGAMETLIPQFDAYADRNFQRSGVPGMAVAIVKNDTGVYLRCFGVTNMTTGKPVTPHTRFQLASISKSFTSASIASMVGRGEVSWDDRIITLDPGFRLSDP